MAFMNLSVKGKASPRHERPFSGKRSGYSNQNANTKANIFGISEPESVDTPKYSQETPVNTRSAKTNVKYKTPAAPRESGVISIPSSAGVITQSQLEATRRNLGMEEPEPNPNEFQVNGKWYIDNPRRPRSRKAPQGVPRLQLGALADKDNKVKKPLGSKPHDLTTPDSKASVSWGTPVNNQYYDHQKNNEEKHYQICNEEPGERLFSAQRKKPNGIPDLDLQLSHSGNEQFRKALRERNKVEKERNSKKESADVTQPWRVEPKEETEEMIKVADEKAKLRLTRKNEIIDEALVGNELTKEKLTTSEDVPPASFNSPVMGPRTKRHQALFNRNPTATTTNSENLLSQRLRFFARILSKDGHDAHRELNGFFFQGDNTLTVYEFRQFGSRSSALPFIQRGTYNHLRGKAKDEPYSFQDISVGNDLLFETAEQLSLPDTLKRKPQVTLRISDVDKESKQKLAFRDRLSPIGVVTPSHDLLQRSLTNDDVKDRELISNVKDLVRTQLKRRGVKSITALGRHFRNSDSTGDGILDRDQLKEALQMFNIQIPPDRFETVWNIVDANHDGVLDYSEFTRNFIGEMNEQRKALVLKAFRRMDPNKRGVVTLMTMAKFYSARQHPHVISGKITEDEVRQQLLGTFENCKSKGEVTYAEFEDYFEGLSLTIDEDEEFVMIMRNCWGI